MTKQHPYAAELKVFADDCETWVWQWRYGPENDYDWKSDTGMKTPPPGVTAMLWRLVPRQWLKDPDSVRVEFREWGKEHWLTYFDGEEPIWDHAKFEIRITPVKHTMKVECEVPVPDFDAAPALKTNGHGWWVEFGYWHNKADAGRAVEALREAVEGKE